MSHIRLIGAAAAIIAAAGAALFAGYQHPTDGSITSLASAAETPAPLYYQDPDGKPFYSPTPKKTEDGRDYVAVPATADASDQPASTNAANPKDKHKIKYYRNPMGLPDTSPMPKKDSMGMDYIPVYEGDETDDGSIKLSPGKIQRTGVKSEAGRDAPHPNTGSCTRQHPA